MFFLGLSAIHWVWLLFWPTSHWTAKLSEAGVSDAVIITLIAKLAVLTLGSLSVYGWFCGRSVGRAPSIALRLRVGLPGHRGFRHIDRILDVLSDGGVAGGWQQRLSSG